MLAPFACKLMKKNAAPRTDYQNNYKPETVLLIDFDMNTRTFFYQDSKNILRFASADDIELESSLRLVSAEARKLMVPS